MKNYNKMISRIYKFEIRLDNYLSLVTYIYLLFLVIDIAPFPDQPEGLIDVSYDGAGDPLRRIILSTIFLSILPVLCFRAHQIILILRKNLLLLGIIVWCAFSTTWAIEPDISFRRMLGMITSFVVVLNIATLKPSRILNILIFVTGTYMIINCFGMLCLSHSRTMDTEGSWRGLHNQKNTAGAASAIAALLWLQLGATRRSVVLITGALLWIAFLIMTVSKTSITLFLILLPYQYLITNWVRSGKFKVQLAFCLFLIIVVAPLISFLLLLLKPTLFADVTFTGRTYIWDFVLSKVHENPILGYGYNSFWLIGDKSPTINEADLLTVGVYGETHNGYIEVLAIIGVVGFIPILFLVLYPFINLFRCDYTTFESNERVALGSLYVILLFTLFHNTMESDFLQGLNFVWVISLMSVLILSVYTFRSLNSAHLKLLRMYQRRRQVRRVSVQTAPSKDESGASGIFGVT